MKFKRAPTNEVAFTFDVLGLRDGGPLLDFIRNITTEWRFVGSNTFIVPGAVADRVAAWLRDHGAEEVPAK